MLFMVIERFRKGAAPVYERFRERGRMAPPGLNYIASWVTSDYRLCYQVMECEEETQLREWISHLDDLVDFEIVPVVTSTTAAEHFTSSASS